MNLYPISEKGMEILFLALMIPIRGIKADMPKGNFIVVNSPLSRRTAIDCVGGFDETQTSGGGLGFVAYDALLSGMIIARFGEGLVFVRVHHERMTESRLNTYSGRYQVIIKNLGDVAKGCCSWRSAKACLVRSRLPVIRENAYWGRLREALATSQDKPCHISFHGIIDFVIETFMLFKRI